MVGEIPETSPEKSSEEETVSRREALKRGLELAGILAIDSVLGTPHDSEALTISELREQERVLKEAADKLSQITPEQKEVVDFWRLLKA